MKKLKKKPFNVAIVKNLNTARMKRELLYRFEESES